MCCEIAEDCTNNLDDNFNNWTDTADNDFKRFAETKNVNGLVCSSGACGISDQLEFPECAWMDDYYVPEIDYYDFRYLGIPDEYNYNISPMPDGYMVNDYFNGSCRYIQKDDGTIVLNFLIGPDCPAQPSFQYSSNFNLTAANLGINEFELVNRCLFFHCSKGIDPVDNPLPAFITDMENDGYLTRHVCAFEQFWNPVTKLCEDFSECYDPRNPDAQECKYDFFLGFDNWLNDSFPSDPDADDSDCFVTASSINEQACCPLFKYGSDTYEYFNMTYFQAS